MTKVDKAPSMPFYGKDAYDDERFKKAPFAVQGYFLWLAWWQWREGSIPADIEDILDAAPRAKLRESRRLWPKVEPFFPTFGDGTRRRNDTLNGHREKAMERRGQHKGGADTTNQKRWGNRFIDSSLSESLSDPYSESLRAATESNGPNLSWNRSMNWDESMAVWRARIPEAELNEILRDHFDKPTIYVEKCVQTAERKRGHKLRAVDGLAPEPILSASGRLAVLVQNYLENVSIRPPDGPRKADWDAAFQTQFGFTPDEWETADEDQCQKWLESLKVSA